MSGSCRRRRKLAVERGQVKEGRSEPRRGRQLAALKPPEFLLDDCKQWFETAVNSLPNGPVEYKLIIVAIDISGAGHSLPANMRMTRFQFGRQSSRSFGYNLEAARHGIDGATIYEKLIDRCPADA